MPRGQERAVDEQPAVELEHAWTQQEATAVDVPQADALLAETPARVIEVRPVGRSAGDDSVRLVRTQDVARQEEPFRFAALSYCWGKPQPGESESLLTKKANLDDHLVAISRGSLPQTLQDAIMVAEKLDIPYIWIDALCIVQDDGEDWVREAAKMTGIYLGSVLTIAVSSSASGSEGSFNQNSEPTVGSTDFRKLWQTVEATLADGRVSRLHFSRNGDIHDDLNTYQGQVLGGPLATRAWTLQEHVLPQRTLYYTSKQLVWNCPHCLITEDNFPQPQHQDLYPIMDYDFPLGPDSMDELWYRGIVEQYSTRQLTFGKDKLVALSGLARATYLNRRVPYIAGLWKDCLLSGLLWRRNSSGCKIKTYVCPSWSWASQNSTVSYEWVSNRPSDAASTFIPRIMDVQWTPSPTNAFGDVEWASITLDTRIRLCTVARDAALSGLFNNEYGNGDHQSLVFSDPESTHLWLAEATMDDEQSVGGKVAIATMLGEPSLQPIFLLLDPPDLDAQEYRRVGIARVFNNSHYGYASSEESENLTLHWKPRTIRLV